MRLSSIAIGIIVLFALFLVVASLAGIIPSRVRDAVASRGLEARLTSVGQADQKLKHDLEARVFGTADAEREIDLDNPTEADFQFLRQVFNGGERAPRMSAARVLVEIQDPRAVGMLARGGEDPEEKSVYCAGALDILRMQTRTRAAELMIDVLEDDEHPPTDVCRPLLEEKMTFISGRSSDLLPDLLGSSRARVRRYALKQLGDLGHGKEPIELSPDLVEAVARLAEGGTPWESAIAKQWLSGTRGGNPITGSAGRDHPSKVEGDTPAPR